MSQQVYRRAGGDELVVISTGKGFKYTNDFGRIVRKSNLVAMDKHLAKRGFNYDRHL